VSEQSLKPCPFCGGAAQFQSIPNEDGNPQAGGEYVECSQCQSCTNLVFPLMDDVKRELAGRWNRRAEQSELALAEARRKALEEAAKVCEASSGVNAIPETNAYANGWNDCRKEAFDARQRSAAAIRAMREPK
jgi:Lar family restriction alleviation protein